MVVRGPTMSEVHASRPGAGALSRRGFLGGTAALLTASPAYADPPPDRKQLIGTCRATLTKVAPMSLVYFWDEKASPTKTTSDGDVRFLQTMFQGFAAGILPFYEFMMTKQFTPRPSTSNGVSFYLPYGGEGGVPLDKLLRDRFVSMRRLRLIATDGRPFPDYSPIPPALQFPAHADQLRLDFTYAGDEGIVGSTMPRSNRKGDGSAEMSISTGFARTVLLACINALPLVRGSRTLLWKGLKLDEGPADSVLVSTPEGERWSVSLLPLLCSTDRRAYAYSRDGKAFAEVHSAFWRTYSTLRQLERGGPMPPAPRVAALLQDCGHLDALSELHFLTMMFIISHETAHSVFMHGLTNDADLSRQHEQQADTAATIHLFFLALTNTLKAERTWTRFWRYSMLRSKELAQALEWYERMFGFGIATNVALAMLPGGDDEFHPSIEQRWMTNVSLWNNCVLACSRTEPG